MIALSSAYKQALVAVEINGKRAFRTLDANCKHSENLLPSLDDALEEIDEKVDLQKETFAVIVGPGSFTGLRIATSLVKGLLAGNNEANTLPLTTFALMAYSYIKNFKPSENFLCIINGLSGYYFICEFDCSGNQIGDEKMVTKADLETNQLQKVSLEEENLEGIQIKPTPEEFLALANEKSRSQPLICAACLLPLYLRKSQAEAALEEKEKK
ncbi:MAG: tRNA (adenosine(37)-N6)-threonylcarbamoyltransferase complex dimerization subunit type 1 TsaB [Clostridia bacterium]|nr:tRNA (adenosine(37)-N6)-threonylcarbamoyltransferase complex dimerization subunit type 1 TsaB [Clostridia bacterium]